jgi:hypothetical protein
MGTGGGGSREMAGTRGAGRKHEGLPNRLSGETGTCPVLSHCAPCLTSIRVAPNPSWGLLNRSRMMGCEPLPLPARMTHVSLGVALSWNGALQGLLLELPRLQKPHPSPQK